MSYNCIKGPFHNLIHPWSHLSMLPLASLDEIKTATQTTLIHDSVSPHTYSFYRHHLILYLTCNYYTVTLTFLLPCLAHPNAQHHHSQWLTIPIILSFLYNITVSSRAATLLGQLGPEDGGSTLLWTDSNHVPIYTTSNPTRLQSSSTKQWEHEISIGSSPSSNKIEFYRMSLN